MKYSCQDFPQQQLDTARCLPTFTCEDCVRLHLHRASARLHRFFTLCSASLSIVPLRVAMLLRARSGSCAWAQWEAGPRGVPVAVMPKSRFTVTVVRLSGEERAFEVHSHWSLRHFLEYVAAEMRASGS